MDRRWLYIILFFFPLLVVIFAFSATTSETRPWWFGDLLTVLSIISGALLILLQLSCQHRRELELQKENFRAKRGPAIRERTCFPRPPLTSSPSVSLA